MEILLEIAGVLLVALAVLHAFFPGHFKWRDELRSVSLLTRQIHYIHTFFIALILLLTGLLCMVDASDLLRTRLGRMVGLGLFVFWLCRMLIQFFGYSPALWRGKRLETAMHVLFSLLWLFFTVTFGLVAFAATAPQS